MEKNNIKNTLDTSNIEVSEFVEFNLKTMNGVLSYKSPDANNYTMFIRLIIEMLLAFNTKELDRNLIKTLKKALVAYDIGDDPFEFDFNDISGDSDWFKSNAEQEEKQNFIRTEEALKFLETLPDSDSFDLQILHYDLSDAYLIDRVLSTNTNFTPFEIHKLIHDKKIFSLKSEQAKNIYLELRKIEVYLKIEPTNQKIDKQASIAFKSAAKVKLNKKKPSRSTERAFLYKKINDNEGLISKISACSK